MPLTNCGSVHVQTNPVQEGIREPRWRVTRMLHIFLMRSILVKHAHLAQMGQLYMVFL